MIKYLSLYSDHLKTTRKILFTWIIGILVIITIFSSSMCVIDFVSPTIYPSIIKRDESSTYKIQQNSIDYFPNFKPYLYDVDLSGDLINVNEFNINNDISLINNSIYKNVNNYNLKNKISSIPFFYFLMGFGLYLNEKNTSDINNSNVQPIFTPILLCEINDQSNHELNALINQIGGGKLPLEKNTSEGLLFHMPFNGLNFLTGIDQTVNLSISIQSGNEIYKKNTSISLSGLVEPNTLSYNKFPYIIDLFQNNYYSSSYSHQINEEPILFVPSIKNFLSNVIRPNVPSNSTYYDILIIHSGIVLNYSHFNPFSSNSDKIALNKFSSSIQNDLNKNLVSSLIEVNFQSKSLFLNVSIALLTYLLLSLFFAIPLIVVAVIIMGYCFSLTKKQLINRVILYHQRGLKRSYIVSFLFINLIIASLIATIFGILTGYIIAYVVSSSDGLLNFNLIPYLPVIPDLVSFFMNLFSISLLISFMTQFKFILELTNKDNIKSLDEEYETWNPYWKRSNFDLLLFGIGFIGTTISYIFIINESIFSQISQIFFYPFAFFTLFGLLLLMYRLIPFGITKFGEILWNRMTGFFSLSFKNLNRRKNITAQAIMIVGIITTTFVILTTLSVSVYAQNLSILSYNNGADAVITEPSFNSTYFYNYSLNSLLEHNYSQYISSVSPFLQLMSNSNISYYNLFLAINTSTFLSTANFPINPGTTRPIQEDIKMLSRRNSTNTTFNIIADKNFLISNKLKIGDSFNFVSLVDNVTFNIIDSFSNWPRIYLNNLDSGHSVYGIIDIAPFLKNKFDFSNSSFNIDESGFYLKFKPNIDHNKISSLLKNFNSVSISDVILENNQTLNNPNIIFITGQINENILFSFSLLFILSMLFILQQFSTSNHEITVEISLGVKTTYLISQFMVEFGIILGSGLISGFFLGFLFSECLRIFLNNIGSLPGVTNNSIIKYSNLYPLQLFAFYFLVSIVFSFIGAILTTWIKMKDDLTEMQYDE